MQIPNKTQINSENPIFKQAELADMVLDKQEKENAEKQSDKYHYKLTMEDVVDGDGRTTESKLAELLANKKEI